MNVEKKCCCKQQIVFGDKLVILGFKDWFPMKSASNLVMNNMHNENQNKRYRKKYNHMKLKVKSLIIENAALCDEVAKVQENIQIVKEERKFLLRKLLEHENDSDLVHSYANDSMAVSNGSRSKPKKIQSLKEG